MSGATTAAVQSIAIPRTENRALPTPHVVYAILITLPVRSWTVYRRYSEFVTLHQAFGSHAPPAALPPKHAAQRTIKAITGLGGLLRQGESSREADEELLQQRRNGLEMYLRAILASPDPAWRSSEEFRAFIELPVGQSPTTLLSGNGGGTAYPQTTRYVPGSYASSKQTASARPSDPSISSADAYEHPAGLTTRTLGAKQSSAPVRESDVTRTLDDRGLMQSQIDQMNAQDRQLDGLAAILRRQKAMGLAINQELSEQDELLTDLDGQVDKTQAKMRSAEKQMDRLK